MTDKKEAMKLLIYKIEDFGLIKAGKSRGHIRLNNAQWDFIKRKFVEDRDTDVNGSSGAGSADSPAVSPSKKDETTVYTLKEK